MDWKIYTWDCLNSYLTTLELEELEEFLNKNKKKQQKKKTPCHPDNFGVGRP